MRARAVRRAASVAFAAVLLSGACSAAASERIELRAAQSASPLIGANYAHVSNAACSLDSTGIVAFGGPSRALIKRQLAAMRAAGIETLRLILWHTHDAAGQSWGVVSSAGGRLGEPYRTNLINYLSDARSAGFKQLTVSFGPEGENAPLSYGPNGSSAYDPSTFEENWDFIKDVRPLIKRYGPAVTHIDLENEGVPGLYDAEAVATQANAYVARLYASYVDAFGNGDVSVSTIAASNAADAAQRVANLIADVRASGRALPGWFDVHPSYTPDEALAELRAIDAVLSQEGLSQPLAITETAYDDPAVAQAIATFEASSTRRVGEVIEWPLSASRPCQDISVSAPYRADAYIAALKGAGPSTTLSASVASPDRVTMTTPYGQRIEALEAGRYTLRVHDSSPNADFHLVGPGVNRSTTLRFRGNAVWNISLRSGTYRYGSDRHHAKLRGVFVVLASG